MASDQTRWLVAAQWRTRQEAEAHLAVDFERQATTKQSDHLRLGLLAVCGSLGIGLGLGSLGLLPLEALRGRVEALFLRLLW